MSTLKIRRIRKRLGLSQEQFAARLGVVRATVTRWENGTRRPSRLAERAVTSSLEVKRVKRVKREHDWQGLSSAALTELWDNSEDAVYDNWKALYGPHAR